MDASKFVMDNIPEVIDEPGAWVGPDIQAAESWIYHLSDEELAEIDSALNHIKAQNLEIPFAAEQFPLPKLSSRLDDILAVSYTHLTLPTNREV